MKSFDGYGSLSNRRRDSRHRWLTRLATTVRAGGLAALVVGLALMVIGPSPASAADDGMSWVVAEVSGEADYRAPGDGPADWRGLRKDDVVAAGAEIRTGRDGRVVLQHRGTTMTASPGSRIALPEATRPNAAYRVLQSVGTLLYRIKERAAAMAAFEVETPYLAAVVKGTVFTVAASAEGGSVHVTEGVVDVQPMLGGDGATLTVGQTARVTSMPGTGVTVEGGMGDTRSSVDPADTEPTAEGADETSAVGGSEEATGARVLSKPKQRGAVELRDVNDVRAKGVTIERLADTDGVHARHPNAVAILVGKGKGLFAHGVTVTTAFGKNDGAASGATGPAPQPGNGRAIVDVSHAPGHGGALPATSKGGTGTAGGNGGGLAVGLDGGTAPGVGGTAPGVGGTAPGLGGSSPGVGGTAPGLGGSSPGLGGTAPGLGSTAPGVGGTAPGLGGTAPGLGGTAPGLGGSNAAANPGNGPASANLADVGLEVGKAVGLARGKN